MKNNSKRLLIATIIVSTILTIVGISLLIFYVTKSPESDSEQDSNYKPEDEEDPYNKFTCGKNCNIKNVKQINN